VGSVGTGFGSTPGTATGIGLGFERSVNTAGRIDSGSAAVAVVVAAAVARFAAGLGW